MLSKRLFSHNMKNLNILSKDVFVHYMYRHEENLEGEKKKHL